MKRVNNDFEYLKHVNTAFRVGYILKLLMDHKTENFQTVTDDQFNHFRFHRDSRKRSRKVHSINGTAVSYKMSITTFQKVTLVSCIVLCVSLFLPKMMLYGVKREIMQKTGKEIIHPASPDVPSFPSVPRHQL